MVTSNRCLNVTLLSSTTWVGLRKRNFCLGGCEIGRINVQKFKCPGVA